MILKKYDQTLVLEKKICLFHGKNDAQKDLILNELKRIFINNFQIYYEKDVIQNPEIFYNEIYTKSFFEKQKLLIIKNTTDKFLSNVQNISERNIEETLIICISDILDKKSKLRSFFEKDSNLISLAFYPDNIQSLVNLTSNFFKKKNISVSFETINLIVNKANCERKFLLNELEKIEIFSKNRKNITNKEINKLVNSNEDNNINELIDNCLAKNEKKIIYLMNENNFNTDDLILIIRIFLSKAKRLLNLVKNFSIQKNIDKTISETKPPIFWKDKEIVKKQIKSWSISQVEKLILEINQIEFLIKTNSQKSLYIFSDFLINKSK